MRRLWEIHAKVRSATQRRGSFSKLGRAGNLPRSISCPSLDHSLAQIRRTFSGGGFGDRFTTSTSRPSECSAHSLPRPRYPASTHRYESRGRRERAGSSRRLMPSWSGTFALWTLASTTRPSVSTSRCLFLPLTFLPPSKPLCSPPTPVVLDDWESAMPALGSGCLPERV